MAQGATTIRETLSDAYLGADIEISGVGTIDVAMPNDLADDYWIRFQIQGGDQIERFIIAGDGYQIPVGKGVTVQFNAKAETAGNTPDIDIALFQ